MIVNVNVPTDIDRVKNGAYRIFTAASPSMVGVVYTRSDGTKMVAIDEHIEPKPLRNVAALERIELISCSVPHT